ncbi:hypothetical protein [Flavobacterium johnsoniae]|uniref:Uncharacterized protein n=1 Tax=Flavobacterium johnsoniae TaxID=986 RepID=A0A1J7BPK9_FLAJO|nr:hypothetical protein [Flavobacterium johnsoniae]OIV40517.1 hypothetical protein BKM63_16680 [Flavobacterium johnsoniae]
MTPSEELLDSNKMQLFCDAIPNFTNYSEKEKEIIISKIREYCSQTLVIPETFTLNQLQGTQSFIIFDETIIC